MGTMGLVADPVFMSHDPGVGHVEKPGRIGVILSTLEERGLLSATTRIPLREAGEDEILKVHSRGLLQQVAATSGREQCWLDGDTPTSPDSYRSALLAAGSLMNAVDAVMAGEVSTAFALVRPPGHHAERERSMGFCLFNNVAVAAHHLFDRHGLTRVLIVDWDVHHGNGTQHAFYSDPRALYFSTHRYPFYPGTGFFDEVGEGKGRGFTVNVPLPPRCDDAEFDAAFDRILAPVAKGFKPEFILVSAGFDTHRADPLGGMAMTENGFARLTGRLLELAREWCGGKVVLTLEGGYDLKGLAGSVAAVIEVCLGRQPVPAGKLDPPPGFSRVVEKSQECLGEFWPGIGSTK